MLIDYSEKINIKNLNILFSLSDFAQSLEDSSVIKMNQTHSNQSIFLNQFSKKDKYSDGIFSSNNQLILEVSVADCMPIFFADKNKDFFGVVHAGWKGLAEGIIENSIELLINEGFKLDNVKVLIGPSIRQDNFEVKNDVADLFDNQFSTLQDGKIFLSLQKIAISKLNAYNIYDIIDVKECTYNTPAYYSYRRNKTEKRMKGRIYWDE
jgi:YfiH family protein